MVIVTAVELWLQTTLRLLVRHQLVFIVVNKQLHYEFERLKFFGKVSICVETKVILNWALHLDFAL